MKTLRLMGVVSGSLACFLSIAVCSSLADSSTSPTPTNTTMPVVTIRATDPQATWGGDPGVFTVTRDGNPVPPLHVYYEISGSAVNGQDYQRIGNWVDIPSGVRFGEIIIRPTNLVQAVTKTVTLTLTNSMLMGPVGANMPVNYIIGSPSSDTVYIGPGSRTNLPPRVVIAQPADGAVFYTPVNIPIVACAYDLDGFVRAVEFFADNIRLGIVTNPASILTALDGVVPPMPPYRPFVLVWSNVPAGPHVLTARAIDNLGDSAPSGPVRISVLVGPPPPPTNFAPIVRITSPANNSVFHAPLNLPLVAFAADRDGYVSSVQFFAGTNSLGFGRRVNAVPGPVPPPTSVVVPNNYWLLIWSNTPPGRYPLTALATDNRGLTSRSAPVNVTILPPPPPPLLTNLVGIFATDPVAIEGTNCWPWLGLAACPPTWENWTATTAVCRYFTNCGPKSAIFTVCHRGPTNAPLAVTYAIGGTASNGVDYVFLPGNVTIPAGQRAAIIPVVPIDDGTPDRTTTVVLRLTRANLYGIDPRHASAAAIILDQPPYPQPPRPILLPDRCFHIASAGPDGAWVRVESTADLSNWTPICTNQVVNGSLDFVDPDAQQDQLRFYRALPEAEPLE